MSIRRVSRLCLVSLAAMAAATCCVDVRADIVFADNFDRAGASEDRDIDRTETGVTNNTGTVFASSAVYSQPWLDPNNGPPTFGVQDGGAANGGGARILNNQLQLAVGQGTSNAFVNHNFTNASILANGNFTVSVNVVGPSQSTSAQGGAFAVGMSLAEAQTAGDAFNNFVGNVTTNPANPKFTNAFPGGNGTATAVVSDFWLALRGDSSLIWGFGSTTINTITGLASKSGIISADFSFSNFNAGTTVNYVVRLNGVQQGSAGTFTWSGTGENYIALDARDGTAVIFDDFSITTVAPVPEASGFMAMGMIALGVGSIVAVKRRRQRA